VEKNWRAVSLAHQCGLFTFGFFILGAPMETKEHLQRTIEFAYKLPLDGATFNILDYTYGSELWDIAHSAGLIDASEFNIAADSARGLALFPREELEQICIEAFDGFYQRPSLWWRVAKKLIKNRDFASLNLLTRATFRLVRDFMG
jgi:radical SAM superfamily enzyme YgiQ (UPF0313 family)